MSDLADLFGEGVEVQVPEAPIPNGIASIEDIAKAAAGAAPVPPEEDDDLFGDADDAASVATEQLEPRDDGLTEEELRARRQLEYIEEDYYETVQPETQTIEERHATLRFEKLPQPQSADGKLWHIKIPSFLRVEDEEFDEMTWEEPDAAAEDFPEENIIRWRRPPSGDAQARESNARIVRWSDGSQSLQVGEEFFDVITNITAPSLKAEADAKSTADATGLTLLVNTHMGAGLLEAQGIIAGTMSFTPYNIASVAHRRLATTMADKHAKTNRTMALEVEKDPELERVARERAEAEKAKAARKERAKAATPKRRRRGMRSMRIDRSDDEGEPMDEGDSDDAEAGYARPKRGGRPSYLDGPDEDDEGFVVESDAEGGQEKGGIDDGEDEEDDLDRIERDAERATRERKAPKKAAALSSDRDADGSMEIDGAPPTEEAAFVRRRLVVGGDDDDDDE